MGKRTTLASILLLSLAPSAPARETTVRIGNAPSIASGALLIAIERGYFREAGIKVVIEPLDTASNAIALLAQNQFQMIEGGLAAGYFNALERNLPITIAMSRVSTPLGHNLMLRADLKDRVKELRQLKGRVIATNGPGSVSTYEIGKILETAGLTIADVELKVIPFAQYSIAFANKAIDAALAIHPFTSQLRDLNLAIPFADSDELIEPGPISISVNMVNIDWPSTNPTLHTSSTWRHGAAPATTVRRIMAAPSAARSSISWSKAASNEGPKCCISTLGRPAIRTGA